MNLTCSGAMQIVRFNWPQYAAALAASAVAPAIAATGLLPAWASLLLSLAAACSLYWLVASLLASHWIYDRSPTADWSWLPAVVHSGGFAPRRWINVHAGYDTATACLRRLFPAESATIDLFDPQLLTEASIHRARALYPPSADTVAGKPDALPLESRSCDAAFLLLAAHELRVPALRRQLFTEIRRVLRPGGRVLLAEHARDAANFLAFGPGFWHFLPSGTWPALARDTGFRVIGSGRVTPFVRWYLLETPR
jgi:SAM-dependent methyltransferase